MKALKRFANNGARASCKTPPRKQSPLLLSSTPALSNASLQIFRKKRKRRNSLENNTDELCAKGDVRPGPRQRKSEERPQGLPGVALTFRAPLVQAKPPADPGASPAGWAVDIPKAGAGRRGWSASGWRAESSSLVPDALSILDAGGLRKRDTALPLHTLAGLGLFFRTVSSVHLPTLFGTLQSSSRPVLSVHRLKSRADRKIQGPSFGAVGGALPAPPPPAPSPPATSPLSFLSDRLRRSVFGFDSEQSGLFQAPVPSPRHARWSCVPASVPPCHSPSHPGATQAHDLSARHQWTCVGWQDLVITTRVPGTLSRMPPTLKRLSLCSSCQLPAGASRLCAGTPVPAASPGDAGVRFPGTNEPAPLPGSTGPSDFLITRGWPCGSLTAFLPRCLFLSFFLWIHRSLGALHEWLKNT